MSATNARAAAVRKTSGAPGSAAVTAAHGEAYARLERATAGLQAPFALIDLDAFNANAADLERRAAGKPIRLASKSLRCRGLQERVLERDGFAGTLAFTLGEALWLASHGDEDIVVAYPTADTAALALLAEHSRAGGGSAAGGDAPGATGQIAVMLDSVEQLDALEQAAAAVDGAELRVCIDVDAGWRALGGRVRIGVKRSPAHTPEHAAALARAILARKGLRLVGVMMYEAQIAGLGDDPPGRPLRARVLRTIQTLSARELAPRRAQVVDAVQDVLASAGAPPLELVNGGGTGSLELTTREDAVSELTAGSGLYGPTLFDAYRTFAPRPAALFALPVVRRPGPGVVTALGGGYLASGAGDAARLPRPHLPAGLRLDAQEGAGEVQTPLLGDAADRLALGDRVYMRHAKAGELCERFASVHVLAGERIVEELPTYRGEGRSFL
ncbi:MAG TPA: alanine racemase [Solirubrobacteraceae bacterium]|jgi:D-serine deaminase-like pyridoxal phosphate-dependent protein|nr:alanine racemase [Solirubrobacteraceae bacterium]